MQEEYFKQKGKISAVQRPVLYNNDSYPEHSKIFTMICHLSKRERIKVPLFFTFEKWDFGLRCFSKKLQFAEQIRYVHNRREFLEKRRLSLQDFHEKASIYSR